MGEETPLVSRVGDGDGIRRGDILVVGRHVCEFSPDEATILFVIERTLGMFARTKIPVITLWDVASGQERSRLPGSHTASIRAASWLANNAFVTASEDRTARVWVGRKQSSAPTAAAASGDDSAAQTGIVGSSAGDDSASSSFVFEQVSVYHFDLPVLAVTVCPAGQKERKTEVTPPPTGHLQGRLFFGLSDGWLCESCGL